MAKESGLGVTTLSIDDSAGAAQAVKNDITQFNLSTPSGVQDVTGIDKSAMERLLLLADGQLQITYVFNDAANQIHAVLKNYRTILAGQEGRTTSLAHSGQTLAMELLFNDYPLTRAADGSLTGQATGQLADGTIPAWS